jgi:7-carboxy-7-deazaguanine synthase
MAARLRPLEGIGADRLLLHEIFGSIQGESTHAGRPCTFVRTTACNLRCTYCDTRHAFKGGTSYSLGEVHAAVDGLGLSVVEITGGEPLLQPAVLPLMQQLCDAGYTVLLETSGSLSVAAVDPRVHKIIDLKTPSSGELAANDLTNLQRLSRLDEVKFVLGSRADYDWAKQVLQAHRLADKATVLMGTVFDTVPLAELAAWIVADRLPVRMQLQLHKYIWDPQRTGV